MILFQRLVSSSTAAILSAMEGRLDRLRYGEDNNIDNYANEFDNGVVDYDQTVDFENANGGDLNFPTPSASGLDGGGGAVHSSYGPAAYPTIFLVGPDGIIKNEDIWPISGVSTFENAFNVAGGEDALVPHECSAGIDEVSLGSINVYPNPSNGAFTINLSENLHENVQIELISLVGKVVFSDTHDTMANGNSIEINTESLESGSYLVKITGLDSNKSTTTTMSIK